MGFENSDQTKGLQRVGGLLPEEIWFGKLKLLPISFLFTFLTIFNSIILKEKVGTLKGLSST